MGKLARIFTDTGGYHVSDDDLEFLDTRGTAYKTKADALRCAARAGFIHYVDGRKIKRIPDKFNKDSNNCL